MFYRDATFYAADDVDGLLRQTGFTGLVWVQTLSQTPDQIREIEPIRAGYGQGAFVAVGARRPSRDEE